VGTGEVGTGEVGTGEVGTGEVGTGEVGKFGTGEAGLERSKFASKETHTLGGLDGTPIGATGSTGSHFFLSRSGMSLFSAFSTMT